VLPAAEIIKLKRNGCELEPQAIQDFISRYVSGEITDYQMSAFLMAIYFQGMSQKEIWALTQSMLHSGIVVDLSHVEGLKIDKHSTGGVGDKTSLIIGPIAAACGVKVPMISGRGLGHTGGTLDKLESIPGFSTQLSLSEFKRQVSDLGLCFIGQTKEICPADKKMYALRDVTGTVECLPLICASIMSKKLAEGIDGLVLDVKFGSGAFMKTPGEAKKLALGLISIARASDKSVRALLTNMDQVLGVAVGNALEVRECIDVLENRGPKDLRMLCIELSAHMIILSKKAKNLNAARHLASEKLKSGEALEVFKKVVAKQGGDLKKLPLALQTYEIKFAKKGYLTKVDSEKIGLASLLLGAGRQKVDDIIDPAAGILFLKKLGESLVKGETLAILHHDGKRDIQSVEKMILEACEIRLQKSRVPRLIKEVI
jgi:pyrimidine-nucleoside phosphorylase